LIDKRVDEIKGVKKMKKGLLIAAIVIMVMIAGCRTTTTTSSPAVAEPAAAPALTVTGLIATPQSWTLDQFGVLNMVDETVEHPKNGPMDVHGVLLSELLALAAPTSAATALVFTASDGYTGEIDLATVSACTTCMVQIGEDGRLNAIMPDQSSKLWVKDIINIEVK
jgi:hypothetical protein